MRLMELYKHKNGRDVAILPVDIRYSTREVYKVKVKWYNIVNPNNVYFISDGRIEIKKEHLFDWKEIKL